MPDAPGLAWGIAVALGGGLLIGLERERRKGRGPDREAAGIRSFTLAALGGAIAQALQQPALVAVGALVVLVLAAIAYYASAARPRRGAVREPRVEAAPGAGHDDERDPGLTTELALFVTYLVGVLAVAQPTLGAAAAVIVAALLASRERLHRFATQALSEAELHDALLLAALALVALPLLPAAPLAWLGGVELRTLGLLMVLILALQAAGHVMLRLFGARTGLMVAGLFSGFVSSTATIAAMGPRARAEPALAASCEAGAMWSTAATWLLSTAMLAAAAPTAAWALAPMAAAGAAVALAAGWWRQRAQPAAPPAAADTAMTRDPGPLRVREAALLALLLTVVSVGVGWAEQAFGGAGVLAGAAVAALADAQSPMPALGTMHAAGRIDTGTVITATLLAISTNALTRSATAFAAGGARYGLRIALSLAASTGAAWAAWAVATALRAAG